MGETLNIRLHIVSPVHIGCDTSYEPTNFYINESTKKLICFDSFTYVKSLSDADRKRFTDICMRDNLLEIFKFIRGSAAGKVIGREVDVPPALVEHYKRIMGLNTFNKNEVIHQFLLARTSFNQNTNEPYIPGSSLKGAIRTAYMSCLASKQKILNWPGRSKLLEERVLGGSFDSDPFSLLKVSDFHAESPVSTSILYAINRKKKDSLKDTKAATGPQQIFEIIAPGAFFEGTLSLDRPVNGRTISTPILKDNLFFAMKEFYLHRFQKEKETLEKMGGSVKEVIKRVNRLFTEKKDKGFLIRLGRHSGAESVTLEGNRQIKIVPKRDGPTAPEATTLWLAASQKMPQNLCMTEPFGWAVLELL